MSLGLVLLATLLMGCQEKNITTTNDSIFYQDAKSIRVPYFYKEDSDTEYQIFFSRTDLDIYLNVYEEKMGNDNYDSHLRSETQEFDATYFENKVLVFVFRTETSGSNSLETKSVTYGSNSRVNIEIEERVPKIGTCDMASWVVAITLDKAKVDDETKVIVNYVTVSVN